MKTRPLLLTTLLLMIVGCSKEPINIETTLIEKDGVYYTKDTNKPYSGPVFSIYDINQKKEEGSLKEGKQEGLWTYFYENGQKKGEGSFKNGDGSDEGNTGIPRDGREGTWTFWSENGQKKQEGTYKDGELDGPFTEWYENGQKEQEGKFKDGKKNGLFTYWGRNGQKLEERTYKDGKEDGLWTLWSDNGTKLYSRKFENGERVPSMDLYYDVEGSVLKPIDYSDIEDISDIEFSNFSGLVFIKEDGEIKNVNILKGQMEGLFTRRYENGKIIEERIYKNDKIWEGEDGIVFINNKEINGTFKKGKLIKVTELDYHDGSIIVVHDCIENPQNCREFLEYYNR